MSDLASILNTPLAENKPPKLTPKGTYQATLLSYEPKQLGKNNNPAIVATFGNFIPGPDVDQAELADVENVATRKISVTFWMTPDAAFRINKFLSAAYGVPTEDTRPLGQVLAEAVNKPCTVTISHRMYSGQDGQMQTVAEINGYASV